MFGEYGGMGTCIAPGVEDRGVAWEIVSSCLRVYRFSSPQVNVY